MSTIIKLNHLSCLKVCGDQAKALLQGQLTCHLDEITSVQSRLGAHCNPQGRVLSFFRIFYHDNSYFLHMPRDILPLALATLNKYAIFYKLKPVMTDELLFIGLNGQPPSHLLSHLPVSTDDIIYQNDFSIVKIPGLHHRYLIFGAADAIEKLYETLKIHFSVLTTDAWKLVDIQHKIPSITPDTIGKFLPHELFLHELNAVSFNKGCYTGQEIIARMQYRGKLKNQLQICTLTSPEKVLPGQDVYDASGKVAGTIVDACESIMPTHTLLISTPYITSLFLDAHQQLPLAF